MLGIKYITEIGFIKVFPPSQLDSVSSIFYGTIEERSFEDSLLGRFRFLRGFQ